MVLQALWPERLPELEAEVTAYVSNDAHNSMKKGRGTGNMHS